MFVINIQQEIDAKTERAGMVRVLCVLCSGFEHIVLYLASQLLSKIHHNSSMNLRSSAKFITALVLPASPRSTTMNKQRVIKLRTRDVYHIYPAWNQRNLKYSIDVQYLKPRIRIKFQYILGTRLVFIT